ncbi:15256_t:CDS:1, partial [Entrophospora sp. SA101]
PKIIRENATHLALFNGGGSKDDIQRVIRQYIEEDPRKASRVINNYLRNGEFIVFDTNVPISNPMSIRVGWMSPLDLKKEIKSLTA